MTSESLWIRAAESYRDAGAPAEAARCFHNAGLFQDAIDIYRELGMHAELAAEYEAAGQFWIAAWTRVHHLGDAAAARALLARGSPAGEVIRRGQDVAEVVPVLHSLVQARCDLAEGGDGSGLPQLFRHVQQVLSTWPPGIAAGSLGEWAVAVAETSGRADQVALIHAAAVRRGLPRAAEQWQEWAVSRLGTRLTLPAAPR